MYPTVFNQNLELKIGKWIRIFWLSVIEIRRQNMFKLVSSNKPSGDQPHAIKELFPKNKVEYFVSYYDYAL